MRQSRQIWRIVVDILCLALVFVPWVVLNFGVEPFHRGFFCDDESLNHPYNDSTISSAVLGIVGLGLPVIGFVVCELVIHWSHKKKGHPDPPYMLGEKPLPFLVYQYYKVIGIFIYGAAFQQTVVNICKYSVGRLRPHFYDVCRPDYTMFNCTDERGHSVYIQGDYCTGTDLHKLQEMRLSFLSGHASFSCYAMVYLSLYLHARFTWKGSRLLCPLLQCIALMMALYCSLSRISDYKHHWSDVFAGAIFGVITACICVSKMIVALGLRARCLGDYARGLGDHARGLGDSDMGLGDHDRGLGDYTRDLGDHARGLGDHARVYRAEMSINDDRLDSGREEASLLLPESL